MVAFNVIQKILYPKSLSVSDKHLSEIVIPDQLHQLRHPVIVQFVKDIVQKQNGFEADLVVIEIELGELHSYNKRLLLTLRAELLNRMIINAEAQII